MFYVLKLIDYKYLNGEQINYHRKWKTCKETILRLFETGNLIDFGFINYSDLPHILSIFEGSSSRTASLTLSSDDSREGFQHVGLGGLKMCLVQSMCICFYYPQLLVPGASSVNQSFWTGAMVKKIVIVILILTTCYPRQQQ